MASIIEGKDEIIKIAETIAEGMGIPKSKIKDSDRCYDIFILAVREYDKKQKYFEEFRKLI